MTDEITQPTVRPISEQAPAAEALAELIGMFGDLPGAYVTIHRPCLSQSARLGLQLDSPVAFEAWRTVLAIAPADVALHASAESVWLSADGVFRGVPVHLTGFEVPLTAEVASTPQAAEAVSA
ncbi:hypothetical protein ACL02U_09800 [Streptomyces sp. MS06]|uniref:hypothetical protein n=1 Tax=Streptomyces sp. MS06 TaxID=3385974 RepID=UPI0039A1E004